MRYGKLLILAGLILIISGGIMLQTTHQERTRYRHQNIVLTTLNSTWTINFGRLQANSTILFYFKSDVNIAFRVIDAYTKEPVPERTALSTQPQNPYVGNGSDSALSFFHVYRPAFVAPREAEYEMIIWKGGPTDPKVKIFVLELEVVNPATHPYLYPGYGSLAAGFSATIYGVIHLKYRKQRSTDI